MLWKEYIKDIKVVWSIIDSNSFRDIVFKILYIFSISFRYNNFVNIFSFGSQNFFFYSSNLQHFSCQADFSSHSKSIACRDIKCKWDQWAGDSDSSGGSIFFGRSRGKVYMYVLFFKKFILKKSGKYIFGIRVRNFNAFLHNISQRACLFEWPFFRFL